MELDMLREQIKMNSKGINMNLKERMSSFKAMNNKSKIATIFIVVFSSIVLSKQTKISRSVSESCQETITTINGLDLICISGCKNINTELIKFNETCYKLSEGINFVNCCGNKLTTIKPSQINNCYGTLPHSWCDMLLIIKKFVLFVSTFVTVYMFKLPILHFMKLIDIMIGFVFKSKKQCITCNKKYKFYHTECNVPVSKKFDYNLIYYVLVFFILLSVTVVSADDSQFNTYDHGDYTEFIIKDIDRHISEFYDKQNHIRVTIDKSYMNFELQYNHDVLEKLSDTVTDMKHSCDSEKDCISMLSDKKTAKSIKKAHDGFSCLFSDAYVCASCGIKSQGFAEVYTVKQSKPTIIANMQINDGEKYKITIDSYEDYIDDNFYIRYLNPVETGLKTFLIKDNRAYTGNICLSPSVNCFGSHILKDGVTSLNYDPVLIDDGHWSKSAKLIRCTTNENMDLNQLNFVGFFDENTKSVHIDKNFGHFSVGVRKTMLLNDTKCEHEVSVIDVTSVGCFNCKYGFTASVKFHYISKRCGVINCKTETYRSRTYVNEDYNEVTTLHMFTDKPTGTITCNSMDFTYKLDNSIISSHYTKSYSSTSSQVELFSDVGKLIDHLSLDFKKKIFFIILVLISSYLTIKHVQNTIKHGSKALKIYRKKNDDYELVQHNFPKD
nr:glycoprotein precursor [Emaravirus tritici]WCJ14538.1 glycoprotein precursor [Emaravirus tritici]